MIAISRISFSLVALAATFVASAGASVRHELVHTQCDEKLRYFQWRAFSASTPEQLSSGGDNYYLAAPDFDVLLANAGLQRQAQTYCNFSDVPARTPDHIAIFAEERLSDDGSQRSIHDARLVINDVEVLTVRDVWNDREYDEHLIEITNIEGRYCAVKIAQESRNDFYKSENLVTGPYNETLTCKLFKVPGRVTESKEESQ